MGVLVRKYGSFYGLDTIRIVNKVVTPKSGLLRIYFDRAYQVRKNGIQEVDWSVDSDTGEILYVSKS